MNQTRTFLLFAWLMVAFLLFMEWNKPAPQTTNPASSTTTNVASVASTTSAGTVPLATTSTQTATTATNTTKALSASLAQISIDTDVLKLSVDLQGGTINASELLKYPVEKKAGSPNVQLQSTQADKYFVAQSGVIAANSKPGPTHEASYRIENGQTKFQLANGQNTLEVPLLWEDASQGLRVRKVLVFTRGSYAITVRHEISNLGTQPWQGFAYEQLMRVSPPEPPKHSLFTNPESFSVTGVAWHSEEEKFKKIAFKDFETGDAEFKKTVRRQSWIGMLQHHFVTVWLPDKTQTRHFETKVESLNGQSVYSINSLGDAVTAAPGKVVTLNSTLWIGPKLQKEMEKIEPSLKLSLDYGIFSFIAQPLFWLLSLLHSWLGNWGWSIIAIVVLLKLVLYKLSAAQYKSMAKMRAIQPRLEALKERYGDDRQQYQIAMMDLYKKEKINPVGGCLPMLIPLPIFFALYWVLLESVEFRQAPWIGWIQNLTAADPYYILPAMNLVIMFVTQKLTPMPGMDPMQKKIMQFMPLVFGALMLSFPAGLVLYWVTNGLLGIIQQQVITRRHGETSAKA
jgi:YidC/Oxa1 family membrane protein insertase